MMEPVKTDSRPATIACTAADTASVVPLSDILDWSSTVVAEGEERTMWNGYGLRRVRSWVTGAVQHGRLPALPGWLNIESLTSYIGPRIGLRNNGGGGGSGGDNNIEQHEIGRRSWSGESSMYSRCCIICQEEAKGGSGIHGIGEDHHATHGKCLIGSKTSVAKKPGSCCCTASASMVFEEKPDLMVVSEEPMRGGGGGGGEKTRPLMSVFQIPAFMVEDYIWDCYRPLSFSYRECIKSWGYVHSELGNILTHMLGAVVFIVLALLSGPVIIPLIAQAHVPAADYIIVYIYVFAVLFCLAASVTFHTLACHSSRKHFRSLRCDFIGILTLIVGSFIPVGYYGFLNSKKILIGYMAMFVAVGVAGVLASILGRVEDPRRAAWRPIIFMGIALSGLVPVIHGAVLNGYQGAVDRISLWYVIGMALLYISGTMVYAFKIPERYRPGRHNVFLHSHQIFHVFVVLAAVCHYVGIIRALNWARRD
ncbi:hypothetical protein GGI07_001648 [Coemansia sp. Benny D115]|nr:hypothetical protein GGI07_001648 [Coemansia sp. Benny D115]